MHGAGRVNKREIAVKPATHQNSAVLNVFFRKKITDNKNQKQLSNHKATFSPQDTENISNFVS